MPFTSATGMPRTLLGEESPFRLHKVEFSSASPVFRLLASFEVFQVVPLSPPRPVLRMVVCWYGTHVKRCRNITADAPPPLPHRRSVPFPDGRTSWIPSASSDAGPSKAIHEA